MARHNSADVAICHAFRSDSPIRVHIPGIAGIKRSTDCGEYLEFDSASLCGHPHALLLLINMGDK